MTGLEKTEQKLSVPFGMFVFKHAIKCLLYLLVDSVYYHLFVYLLQLNIF